MATGLVALRACLYAITIRLSADRSRQHAVRCAPNSERPVKIRCAMSGVERAVESGSVRETVRAGRLASADLTGTAIACAAIGFGLYLYLGRLGLLPLQTGNEAMYAAPPIHMLESGDYLVPIFRGANFLDKPPLSLWLIAASYRLFGISVATARLPAALISLGTILAVALWVGRRRGNRAGLLAALVLTFTYSFWTFTRYFAADALFALTVTLAVIALDAATRSERGSDFGWGALAGGALALAFLSKGLAGIVLPLGAVGTGLALDRARPVRPGRRGLMAAAVLLALIGPWHWAMTQRLGAQFWKTFYWENQFLRGATSRYMRVSRSPFYYLPVIAWAAFPWSFLLPGSLRRQRLSSAPLGWFLFGLAFWSVLVMKRDVYLMTVFPAIAILVAERLDREASREFARRPLAWILAAAGLATALALLAWVAGLLAGLVGWSTVSLLGVAGALVLAGVLAVASRPMGLRTCAAVALACCFCFLALERLDQGLARYDPIPQWGERVRRECLQGCDRFLLDVNTNNLEFYSRLAWEWVNRPPELIERTRHRQGFLVMRSSDERLLAELPMRFEVLDRRPWLPGDWSSVAFWRRRSPIESLSLVSVEVPASVGSETGGTRGSRRLEISP
jgi:4-amino-4-deoxy-L-arabinose transferase-like glycosyltransferase